MKFIYFFKEDNDFTDILSDSVLKKEIDTKIKWYQHLILGFDDELSDKIKGYIVIKYGENIRTDLIKDYRPIPYKDYFPKKSRF